MPYEWQPYPAGGQRLHLWPYRSLSRHGFVGFIGATTALIALPLFSLLGTPVLWGVLPFLALAIAGIWWGLQRNYRDAQIIEDLTITPQSVTLTRHGPRGKRQDWHANTHWVRVDLHPTGGPVPHYITLAGGPRVVEIGAFLSVDERLALLAELRHALATMRTLPDTP